MAEPNTTTGSDALQPGVSPYATGGGGITFERKVAVMYLAHLLVGDGAAELGHERRVVSVAFQQAPEHPVDDLVVRAARSDESEASLILALGVRRAPKLIKSDEATQNLISDFVRAIINVPTGAPEHRFALVVAGPQEHAEQLAELATLAQHQVDATAFFALVDTPNKFRAEIRGRLEQIEGLVGKSLNDLGVAAPDTALVQQRTWELLYRLTIVMPRLESPDESDWAAILNSLVSVARGGDLAGASSLRDRLVALADEYPPSAATVDYSALRRAAHARLDSATRRHQQGWRALDHLNERALLSVRDTIASSDGERRIHINRDVLSTSVLARASSDAVLLAYGESGVGKSALVVNAANRAAIADPAATQVLSINLRHLTATTLEFESILGATLTALLRELSAPQRLLVIDSADAAAEGRLEQLRLLAGSARQAGVGVIAISSADNKQVVHDALRECFGAEVVELAVPGLTDTEVADVVERFPELANLASNSRSRELLRRPVVIDLLVRGGISGIPLSDADAMQHVWLGLVRRHEKSDRGTPDARDLAMLRLADLVLSGGDSLSVVGAIDPSALEGLRQEGLLRTSPDDPFKIGPEFAHDEVRRYAVARLLLADEPTSRLLKAGVPRWSLGAARLTCQVRLSAVNSTANPFPGRFARLQTTFDALVTAGYGDRWADVPGEALLTIGDPAPVLRDAWPMLRADNGKGLQRLCRLVDQRLRDESGLIRIPAVEPLINLLLEDETPWLSGDYLEDVLREWLRALVVAATPSGHPLRCRLRDRLVAACDAGDRRLADEQAAEAARLAARTPGEIEEERRWTDRHRWLVEEVGFGGPRRKRREVPDELREEIVVELLALLGPDLGEGGEAILRRVAQDAPAWLAPAVEEFLTGAALARYGRGFLAELTEAYYLDEEGHVSSFREEGIRGHHSRSAGVTPLTAWWRGPFMPLFQTDFRNGVAVLNRMLNHAAGARTRTLARLDAQGSPIDESSLAVYQTELNITGTARIYTGDNHVWNWYRGTGVGPYPCMSALQALERTCDRYIQSGTPIPAIAAILLDGCESVAMVALVVGLIVRHLDSESRLLDLYFVEPTIWHEEFSRLVQETGGLAASSDGITAKERRRWSLRDAAMFLVVQADDARAAELRAIGEELVANTRRQLEGELADVDGENGAIDAAVVDQYLLQVRSWASTLNRENYRSQVTEGGLLIQNTPPDEIEKAMEPRRQDMQRTQSSMSLMLRYATRRNEQRENVTGDSLIADLTAAREMLEVPPTSPVANPWDVATAVAAYALEAHLLRGELIPKDLLLFAAETVLGVSEGRGMSPPFEFEETYYEQAADRSASRVIPLLLLPNADALRAEIDGAGSSAAYDRAMVGGLRLARAVAHETRLHLARGLDRVWEVPCAQTGRCHHDVAFEILVESMRDSAFGEWEPKQGRRNVIVLDNPVVKTLANTADDVIYVSRLDAAIRALAPASLADVCVSSHAAELFDVVISAQRRALLAHEHNMDERGSHALVAARALVTIARRGDYSSILRHLDAYADNATLLCSFLRALSAAAEEHHGRAATAQRLWPEVVSHVLGMPEAGHRPFDDRYYGDYALASLLPNPAGESTYLYRELESPPIVWWTPLAWRFTVEKWLPFAEGHATCVDQIVSFLGALPVTDQVIIGLPWVASLVLPDPSLIANRTFLLSSWLIRIRTVAVDVGELAVWQRIVDALVVAGATKLAAYSE